MSLCNLSVILLLILTFSKVLVCFKGRGFIIFKLLGGAEQGTFCLMPLIIRETRKLLLLMFRRKESYKELRDFRLPFHFLDFTAIRRKIEKQLKTSLTYINVKVMISCRTHWTCFNRPTSSASCS